MQRRNIWREKDGKLSNTEADRLAEPGSLGWQTYYEFEDQRGEDLITTPTSDSESLSCFSSSSLPRKNFKLATNTWKAEEVYVGQDKPTRVFTTALHPHLRLCKDSPYFLQVWIGKQIESKQLTDWKPQVFYRHSQFSLPILKSQRHKESKSSWASTRPGASLKTQILFLSFCKAISISLLHANIIRNSCTTDTETGLRTPNFY